MQYHTTTLNKALLGLVVCWLSQDPWPLMWRQCTFVKHTILCTSEKLTNLRFEETL